MTASHHQIHSNHNTALHTSKDIQLLNETGLIDVQFANWGQSVVLSFCHSETGQNVGQLICHDVIDFHVVNTQLIAPQTATQAWSLSQNIVGFSHYIHRIHIKAELEPNTQQTAFYWIDLRPYAGVYLRCLDYEIMLEQQNMNNTD